MSYAHSHIDKSVDDWIETLKEKESIINLQKREVEKLSSKIQELQTICFESSEAVYAYLGFFINNLPASPAAIAAVKQLKDAIDKNLSTDQKENNYKNYLESRYLTRGRSTKTAFKAEASQSMKTIEDAITELNDKFIKEYISEDFQENDITVVKELL